MKDTLTALTPLKSSTSRDLVGNLATAASHMQEDIRAEWLTRFMEVYGDLSGQRSLSAADLAASLALPENGRALHDLVFALQTYYVLTADLLAISSLEPDAGRWLRSVAAETGARLERVLRKVSSGTELEERGIVGARNAFHFEWYTHRLSTAHLAALREYIYLLAEIVEHGNSFLHAPDPMHALYISLMPKNLLHVTGEFYTPYWLAELLVQDADYTPEKSLIDPFGGSGVFLLAALSRAKALGASPIQILDRLCLFDLNPVACAAARANLVMALAPEIRSSSPRLCLPVLCADAHAPALIGAEQQAGQLWSRGSDHIWVDGESIEAPSDLVPNSSSMRSIAASLRDLGVELPYWLPSEECDPSAPLEGAGSPVRRRRILEHLAVLFVREADIIATNPPWIGWEYMSRPYRSHLDSAWRKYGLFTAKGRDAAFLKEDLSTLSLTCACDHYLRRGGDCVTVLRKSILSSTLAGKGLRRLSLYPNAEPVSLKLIRDLSELRVFQSAMTNAVTWQLRKGQKTRFPVKVVKWRPRSTGPSIGMNDSLDKVRSAVVSEELVAERSIARSPGSAWTLGDRDCLDAAKKLRGETTYRARTGVFTGGANAVYYLKELKSRGGSGVKLYRNVVDRAKRKVPQREMELEPTYVFRIVRGRDIARWQVRGNGLLLCPHTKDTRMRAVEAPVLRASCPLTMSYLESMREFLDDRRGFAAWEQQFKEESFYAIQRVGEYTFSPFKVAWRYIAQDFLVAVVGPDMDGRPQLCNDKVMFIPVDTEAEAYYLCGILSSCPVRWLVMSTVKGTQISTSALDGIRIPAYDSEHAGHVRISEACCQGHRAVASGALEDAEGFLAEVNRGAASVLGLGRGMMEKFRRQLEQRYGKKNFTSITRR